MQNTTAILFFTRPKKAEANEKCFHVKKRFNKAIAASLIENTLGIIKESQIPYEVFLDNGSTGKFGDKLASAVSLVFEKGFEKVIIIGNDCPSLNTKLLNEAKKALDNNDLVAGPDWRGGLYLLGISKKIYNSAKFSSLPWQESNLYASIKLKTLAQGISFVELKRLRDFNYQTEIIDILNFENRFTAFLTLIKSIIFYFIKLCSFYFNISRESYVSGLRAPPATA